MSKQVYDCATGKITREELTTSEVAQRSQWLAEENIRQATEQATLTKRQTDILTIKTKAAKDADFAALARIAGIDT